MNRPLVSVCIPAYNAVARVKACLESLLRQNYEALELIIVNDCSTDDTLALVQTLLQSETAINVVLENNTTNCGPDYTRRRCAELAKGEYLAFVDADDYVDANYIAALVNKALETNADIVDAPYWEETDRQQIRHDAYAATGKSYLEDALRDNIAHLWGKLIRRQLFLSAVAPLTERFDYLEDRLAILQLCHAAGKISSVSDTAYHYHRSSQSLSAEKNEYHFHCLMLFWDRQETLLREWGEWERYAALCRKIQMQDKVALMHYCRRSVVCRSFADLFGRGKLSDLKGLSCGLFLTGVLVYFRCWHLLAYYRSQTISE